MQIRAVSRITRRAKRDGRFACAQGDMFLEARQVRAQPSQRSATGLDSLDEFYDAYAARLYGLALRVLHGDLETAEDIVVEALVVVWQSRPAAEEGETADLELVLLRQVRERCIDVLRGRQDVGYGPGAGAISRRCTTPATGDGATPTSAAICEELAALSLDQRQAIERAFYQGQTSEQIAKEMGISKGAIHRAMRSGLRTLADHLSIVRTPASLAAKLGGRKRSPR